MLPKLRYDMLRKNIVHPKPTTLLVISIVLGLSNAIVLMGLTVINPGDISWLTRDNLTHYLGWAFYRHEHRWTLPLAWTGRIGYPIGASIAFLESIPLVAVLLRPLSDILPEPFQYLGLYATLCFVLQAYFGLKLCSRLFGGHIGYTLIGCAFFLLSPPLTWLLFGHFPHLSHWLILAGLDLYFRDIGARAFTWFKPYLIILAIVGGINPYLAAICLLVAFSAVARLLLERKCGWATATGILSVAAAVLVVSMLTFGYLASPDPLAYVGPGYGEFSLNLLSPVNPTSHGSIVIPPIPLARGGQEEGYNYLGIGVIALLLMTFIRAPRALFLLRDRRLVPIVGLALVCTIAAVSSTVTLGSVTLVNIKLPRFALVAAQSLRASGRLFWPVQYLLILAALSLTFRLWKGPYRPIIFTLALAVQIADLWTLRSQVRASIDLPVEDPLRSPVWRNLGRDYANLMVIPPYQCGPNEAPGGLISYAIFGKLAASQRMRTNDYYAARYTRREILTHCGDVPRSVLGRDELDAHTVYVVSNALRAAWEITPVKSHSCERVDGFNLCTLNSASHVPLGQPIDAVAYSIGERLDFTAGGNARSYMVYGWAADSGTDGTWTEGRIARLRLGLSRPPEGALSIVLMEGSRPFVSKLHTHLDVDVVINDQIVDRWSFEYGSTTGLQRRTLVPRTVVAGRERLDFEFRILNPEAPASVGEGPDGRLLGLNVRGLSFSESR